MENKNSEEPVIKMFNFEKFGENMIKRSIGKGVFFL